MTLNKGTRFIWVLLAVLIFAIGLPGLGLYLHLSLPVLLASGAVLGALVFLFISAESYYPLFLMKKGRYDQALKKLVSQQERQIQQHLQNAQNIYNRALCHFRKGEPEPATELLGGIDLLRADKNLLWAYHSLMAEIILLTRRDLGAAEKHLQSAESLKRIAENLLLSAYLESLRGRSGRAEKLMDEYRDGKKTAKVLPGLSTFLLIDRVFEFIVENYYMGLIYEKAGKRDLSASCLKAAAECGFDNIYSRRASEALAGKGN